MSTATGQSISRGTQITAQGGLWTVTGCGNGRYTVRLAGDKRSYTMPCTELHADVQAGRAFITTYPYRKQETAGVHYKNVMRNYQKAVRS